MTCFCISMTAATRPLFIGGILAYKKATDQQRKNWDISSGRLGIHWQEIDQDLSINGILSGAKAPDAIAPSEAAE